MRKLIFAINVTIDGFADHTAMIADDELHDFFTKFLDDTDAVLYGRKTYQLMESYWPTAADDPNANKSTIEFANKINSVSKIVISKTLHEVSWNNSRIIKDNIIEEVLKLKNRPGKNLAVGSISTASFFINNDLIDEYWLLIHPVILGNGKKLFAGINNIIRLELINISRFKSGVVALHYKAKKAENEK